tara:strand:+ start:303 stop:746 length:444 start_codon:yes stop_codon:yes gene_type:complete
MGNSNKQKGHTAEFFACYHIAQEGFKPFLIPHGQAFDVFATNDITGELIRVQVKSTNQYSTSPNRDGSGRPFVIPKGFVWNLQIGISKTSKYDFKALEIFALVNLEQEMIAFIPARELANHPTKATIKVRDMAQYTFKRAMNLLHST